MESNSPPLAMTGLTEQQARDAGYDIKVDFKKTNDWYSYKRTNEQHTAFKTIINKENGQILAALKDGKRRQAGAEFLYFIACWKN